MPHVLYSLAEQVDATHKGLGSLFAMAVLCTKAQQVMIIVAPSGCGKSKVIEAIERETQGALFWRAGTMAGITSYQDLLTNFRSVVVVDDLAAMGTEYRQEQTLSVFTDLVYSHRVRVDTGHQHFYVEDFQGACLIGAQPVVLKKLVRMGAWDGHLHDKTLRYYHLARPLDPCLDDIDVRVDYGIALGNVTPLDLTDELFGRLARYLGFQWGTARAMEHTRKLTMAAAALDGREQVEREDVIAVAQLCKPLTAEQYLLDRPDFEAPRRLRNDLYYLLLEFASHGTFTIDTLIDTYKVSRSSAERIMETHTQLWKVVYKNPTTYAPSDKMNGILESVMPRRIDNDSQLPK